MKNSHKFYGLLIFRSNIQNPTIVNIRAEIILLILECNILLETIHFIQKQQWKKFDGLAGDQKCQTRASMILDLIPLITTNTLQLQNVQNQILKTLKMLQNLTINYQKNNYKFISYYKKNIQFKSLKVFFEQLNIRIKISKHLKFLALSMITTLKKENFQKLTITEISNKQIEKTISAAKMLLCELSVKYEQNLSEKYGNKEEQALLQIIGHKQYACGQSIMTAFAPSFTVILKKMAKLQQYILNKLIIFCLCGGVQKKIISLYKIHQNSFEEIQELPLNTNVIITQSYQYPGSLKALMQSLKIVSLKNTIIPPQFYKKCHCKKASKINLIDNPYIAFLAIFAQHPQFINNNKIDFKTINLENSFYKKYIDHLNLLPGFNIEDMSNLFIVHIYASTIKDALKEDEELIAEAKA